MRRTRRLIAALSVAGPAAVMAFAPAAYADPPAGAVSPGDTIYSLATQGYDVQVDWIAGKPSNVPLRLCSVTGVDTSVQSIATVSVDCPPALY